MEFDEAKELAFLNALTRQNRRECTYPVPARRMDHRLALTGFVWFAGTVLMILLAHVGVIPGWLMHLGTEILTFRFAMGLGRRLK